MAVELICYRNSDCGEIEEVSRTRYESEDIARFDGKMGYLAHHWGKYQIKRIYT